MTSVSACLLVGGAANAQGTQDKSKEGQWYVGLDGYFSVLGTEQSQGSVLDLQNEFKNGGGFAGIVGYDYGKIRLEAEIGKHFHTVGSYAITNDAGLGLAGTNATSGKSNLTHYMVNAVIDVENTFNDSNIEPYIGAGIGAATQKWSEMVVAGSTLPYGGGSDTDLAYQAFAGLRIPVAESVDFSVKYRYMSKVNANLTDRAGGRFDANYDVHDFGVGLTYYFGAKKNDEMAKKPQPIMAPEPKPEPAPKPAPVVETPPPPPPAPMPEPVQVNKGPYSVYFDFDSSDITSMASDTIKSAAMESKKVDDIMIEVSGHADRSGANSYNDDLARKRAEMVRIALIAEGINGSTISITSFGENQTEVNTADGVKEGRNRRVVILLK